MHSFPTHIVMTFDATRASGREACEAAGVSAEELLARMQTKVDELVVERDRLVGEQRRKYPGTNKAINGPIERRFR